MSDDKLIIEQLSRRILALEEKVFRLITFINAHVIEYPMKRFED